MKITHELLHKGSSADKNTKEVESVAYAVCNYFGIDTSKNSFGYVADWSKDKQLDILRSSLETITRTVNEIINSVLSYFGDNYIENVIPGEVDEIQRAEELYEIGMSFYNDSDYKNAVNYFKQAVDLENSDAKNIE